ncbi:unnamed protein product, partial [Gulo gulo]
MKLKNTKTKILRQSTSHAHFSTVLSEMKNNLLFKKGLMFSLYN